MRISSITKSGMSNNRGQDAVILCLAIVNVVCSSYAAASDSQYPIVSLDSSKEVTDGSQTQCYRVGGCASCCFKNRTLESCSACSFIVKLNGLGLEKVKEDAFKGQPHIVSLSLANNSISSLEKDTFDHFQILQILELWDNRLSHLPSTIFGSLPLRVLDLRFNSLEVLPESIFSQNTYLMILFLNGNKLTSLPTDLFKGLSQLRQLYLDINEVEVLPEQVFDDLGNLLVLTLDRNKISALPKGVFQNLINLRQLHLYSNELTTFPEEVFDALSELQILWLDMNPLLEVPKKSFANLGNIIRLSLSKSNLTEIPEDLFNGLTKLYDLWLFDCNFRSLPPNLFSGLIGLKRLMVHGNPLESLSDGLFDDLTRLLILSVGESRLSKLPSSTIFDKLKDLKQLWLDRARFTSMAPGIFDELESLQFLNLESNELEYLRADVFDRLTNLALVVLLDNPGAGPNTTCPEGTSQRLAHKGATNEFCMGIPSASPTPSMTATTSITASASSSMSNTASITASASETPSITPSGTGSSSVSSTALATSSPSGTGSETASATASSSVSSTVSPTGSPSGTSTPSTSETPSITASGTASSSVSSTALPTTSSTETRTSTPISATPSISPSVTASFGVSSTKFPTASPPGTGTVIPSPTASSSVSSANATPTMSPCGTPVKTSVTPSSTATMSAEASSDPGGNPGGPAGHSASALGAPITSIGVPAIAVGALLIVIIFIVYKRRRNRRRVSDSTAQLDFYAKELGIPGEQLGRPYSREDANSSAEAPQSRERPREAPQTRPRPANDKKSQSTVTTKNPLASSLAHEDEKEPASDNSSNTRVEPNPAFAGARASSIPQVLVLDENSPYLNESTRVVSVDTPKVPAISMENQPTVLLAPATAIDWSHLSRYQRSKLQFRLSKAKLLAQAPPLVEVEMDRLSFEGHSGDSARKSSTRQFEFPMRRSLSREQLAQQTRQGISKKEFGQTRPSAYSARQVSADEGGRTSGSTNSVNHYNNSSHLPPARSSRSSLSNSESD